MTSAERTRRYRKRIKMGVRVVPAPIGHRLVQSLIARGFLDEKDEGDAAAVSKAILCAAEKMCDASR